MKINQIKAGVMLSYLYQGLHILSGIFYTPVMLRLLGQSEYGLYQLAGSVIAYLGLLSFGFSGGYMRFYYRFKTEGDEKGVAKLNGMFFLIFIAISMLSILCGLVLVVRADLVFGTGLTVAEVNKSRILMGIMLGNLAATFVGTVYNMYISANEKFFFQRIISILSVLLNPLITLPLLMMGYGSIAMAVVVTIINLGVIISNVIFCHRKLNMKFVFNEFNFGLLKEIWVFTFFIFVNLIVDQINWSVDKFLLGRIKGTVAVAIYGVAASLNSMYMNFSTSISSVFAPRINKLVASNQDNAELSRLFARVGRVQFILLALIISGYTVYGREFIAIWAGDGYDAAYAVGLFLMMPLTVPLIQNLGIEIQRAKNKHKVRSFAYLFIAVSNIFISIVLIGKYGVVGAAIGTAISLILGNMIFMNIYYHKALGLDMIYFWKEIAKLVPAVLITAGIGTGFKFLVGCQGILMLAINICLYSLVYIAIQWIIGMNNYEKELFGKPIKKIGAQLCRK